MSDEKEESCSYCGLVIRGEVMFRIHRDGMGEGPEVPLCKNCGGGSEPTCEELWRFFAATQRAKQKNYWKEK